LITDICGAVLATYTDVHCLDRFRLFQRRVYKGFEMKFVFMMTGLLMALASAPAEAAGKSYKGKGWNVSAYDNCGLPVTRGDSKSISWVKTDAGRKLRVVLNPGDVGKCSTDNQARHRAPYWERAELHQKGELKPGRVHKLSAEFTLLRGFTGDRETFFQIHGWNGSCHAYPPMMMMFDRGSLRVWALRGVSGSGIKGSGRGQHKPVQQRSISTASLIGKPQALEVVFDNRSTPGKLSVSLNGQPVVSQARVDFAPCAKPHFKMGIYRPGGKGSKTSEILFDKVMVHSSK
jgi:hypothetical protein